MVFEFVMCGDDLGYFFYVGCVVGCLEVDEYDFVVLVV